MYLVHGFVTKADHIKNLPGEVAEFFELSPFALTYSRARGEYQHPEYSGDVLHTFKSIDLETSTAYMLDADQVKEVFSVVGGVLSYMNEHQFPYDTSDFRNTIQAAFSGKILQFTFGAFKTGSELTMPEWVTWESVQHPGAQLKIWLSKEAFENQYTDYEIVTVSPIDNLDRFFGNYGTLVTELNAITVSQTFDRIQEFKGTNPDTYTRAFTFDYVNPNNTAQKTPVRWGIIVYGKNGDNIDSIKDAIVDFVLSNSTRPQADWEVIFPSIFQRTEFLFIPRWKEIAVPNLTELSALYSSVANPAEAISYAKEVWYAIHPTWIEQNLSIVPFDYKAISLLALNGESNVIGKKTLRELFPDYIPVGTSTLDFSRMALKTRNWVLKMVELINIAEKATEYTNIANPIRRIKRNGVLYVTVMYDDVNYLVATRSNFL